MEPDNWHLYRHMFRSRLFEEAVTAIWNRGLISGEMHLGTGEEAIVAGTVLQLKNGDAMALDHRGTSAMLMRGVDPKALLREFLGHPDGLCGGMGGHMHLYAPEYLAASSGIVGSSGPAAAGFALAARYLRPGTLALAFFGEGAFNQGMMMESMNLAAVWLLPVLFICKDNGWSITTRSAEVSGEDITDRARSLGIPAVDIDGADVLAVWQAASEAMERARRGEGATFLRARCRHFEGHFLGYQALRIARRPLSQMKTLGPILRSVTSRQGAPLAHRLDSLRVIGDVVRGAREESLAKDDDPLQRIRPQLTADPKKLDDIETAVIQEIDEVVETVLRDT